MQMVEEGWNTNITRNSMWIFQQKLKILSKKLSHWFREIVGNVFDHVSKWEAKIQSLEELDLLYNNGQC